MIVHQALLQLLHKLGYSETDGVCHGFSTLWDEACLLGEEKIFDDRVKRIIAIAESGLDVVKLFDKVKEKKGYNLTTDDLNLLDIIAFFDSIELFQSIENHTQIFGSSKAVSLLSMEAISSIASSEKISKLGGLAKVYSQAMIQSTKSLCRLLDNIEHILHSIAANPNEVFCFLVSSLTHTIALSYDFNRGWGGMNINTYPASYFKSSMDVAELIQKGLDPDKILVINISLILTKHNPLLSEAREKFSQLAARYFISQNFTPTRQALRDLLQLAAVYGQDTLIPHLASYKIDFDATNDCGGTALWAAARFNHANVIAALALYHADINKRDNQGCSPAWIAAHQGCDSSLAELVRLEADVSMPDHHGCSPAWVAAGNGRVLVMQQLISAGVDLNKADNHGCTPAWCAARFGHVGIIELLAQQGAALNQPDFYGITPMFIAIAADQLKVVEYFLNHGISLKDRIRLSVDELQGLVKDLPQDVSMKVKSFIDQQLNKKRKTISLSYYQFASLIKNCVTTFIGEQIISNQHSIVVDNQDDFLQTLCRFSELKSFEEELLLKFTPVEQLRLSLEKDGINKNFIELISEHTETYHLIVHGSENAIQKRLLSNKARLEEPSNFSRMYYGVSWPYKLAITANHLFALKTPASKSSFVFNALDRMCKSDLKQLTDALYEQLQDELSLTKQEVLNCSLIITKNNNDEALLLSGISYKAFSRILSSNKLLNEKLLSEKIEPESSQSMKDEDVHKPGF